MTTQATNRIYIISDRHLEHPAILEFESRPVGYEKLFRERWNKVVKKQDTVIDLGDVIFNNAKNLKSYMNELNGKKILVRGNHDKNSIGWYLSRGYDMVCDKIEMNDYYGFNVVLTHKPMFEIPEGFVNVHGHLHSGKVGMDWLTDRHYLYNPEKNGFNYTPVKLNKFLQKWKLGKI